MLKKVFFRGKVFFQDNFDRIFSWFFLDYVFLLFWEGALPGMVSEVFNLHWLLLLLGLCLFCGRLFFNRSEKRAIILQNFSSVFFLLIFSLAGLFFLEWWAANFIPAIFFSLFSLLTIFFLAQGYSQEKE